MNCESIVSSVMSSSQPKAPASTSCPPVSQAQCFCAPLSFSQSRCSSLLISDKCPYSRLSCGSISPICCDNVSVDNNNEIKIIITDPQDTNVFSSVHDPHRRANCVHISTSPFFSSINNDYPWVRVLVIFWAVAVPAVVGLVAGLSLGWDSLPGLAVSSCLFFASASFLVTFLVRSKCCQLGVVTRPQYCSLPGENNKETCLSPNTQCLYALITP